MKNKKLTYVLIPLVLIIWGLIIYKIINHNNDQNAPAHIWKNNSPEKKEVVKDTFSIAADYDDPFLRGKSIAPPPSEDILTGEYTFAGGFTKKKEPKPEIKVPDLLYYGVITNPKNKHKLGLFRLNNKDVMLKEGETFNDFKIVKLYNDSVKTTYQKIKKTFKKNSNAS